MSECTGTIQEHIDLLVGRLSCAQIGLLVEDFPDDPQEYTLLNPRGAALVSYSGSRYSASEDIGIVVQEREIHFDINLIVKSLRNKAGAYSYLDAVRVALTGFAMPGCTKLRLVNDGFVEFNEKKRTWQFMLRFATKTVNVEVAEEERTPLLKKITLDGAYGTEVYQ